MKITNTVTLTEHAAAQIKDAVSAISMLTDTNSMRIIQALVGVAYSEEDSILIINSDGDV